MVLRTLGFQRDRWGTWPFLFCRVLYRRQSDKKINGESTTIRDTHKRKRDDHEQSRAHMTSTYRAVIFDLDGTLLDTLDDLTEAFNIACGQYGCRRYLPQDYKTLIGHGARQVIAALFEQHKIPASNIDPCFQKFQDAYRATELAQTSPYPGIHDMLQRLSTNKLMLNVLSNKPHHDTVRCVRQFFNIDHFVVVWGHRDSKPLKPDPMATTEILEMCHISSHQGLFVGDTAVDIEAAHNANMQAVGVTWGFRTRDELKACGADTIVDDPTEIVRLCV